MAIHQRSSSRNSLSCGSPELNPATLADTDSTRTNTLVLASMPAPFFEQVVLDALRSHFESFGEVHTWAPLKAFARAIVVYYDEEAAELAKESCDSLFIDATDFSPATLLRVYRADPTPLDQLTDRDLLRPPQLEKNFLISPPGSPPVGWEQIREEPPNHAPLADDLMNALKKLQLQHESHHGVEVLMEPEAEGGPGIGIYVEDCDGGLPEIDEHEPDEAEWVYGQPRPQFRPVPTALPPMRVGA